MTEHICRCKCVCNWRFVIKMMSQSIFIWKLGQNRLGNVGLWWLKIGSNGSKQWTDICFGSGNKCPPQGDIWDHIIPHLDNETEVTLIKCTHNTKGGGRGQKICKMVGHQSMGTLETGSLEWVNRGHTWNTASGIGILHWGVCGETREGPVKSD